MSDQATEMTIVSGARPGLLGDVASLHGRYYARDWNFPTSFECKVASEFAAFLSRYDPAKDVVLSIEAGARVLASITLDGSDATLTQGQAHLRWFIVDDALRGRGIGKRLIGDAIAFARSAKYGSIYLTTFRGLDAASALYSAAGFAVTEEREGQTWGRLVTEQRLELSLP